MVLPFDTCVVRSCLEIEIVGDSISEDDEIFRVTLARTPTLDNRISLDPVSGEVLIIENNGILSDPYHGCFNMYFPVCYGII